MNHKQEYHAMIQQVLAGSNYPVLLFMYDGECLCRGCVKENVRLILRARQDWRSGWHAIGAHYHMEGEPVICAHCGAEVESAYGDPEEDSMDFEPYPSNAEYSPRSS
jgi:hypothetical protein